MFRTQLAVLVFLLAYRAQRIHQLERRNGL